MADHFLIVLTGDKGGIGKSTLAVLLSEWLHARGMKPKLIDADPNQTTQVWIDKCKEKGYEVGFPDETVTIVDTGGTSGSSLTKYILHADLIIVPFQPHVADLEVIVAWFLSLKEDLQNRVVFVPNRLTNTIEQRDGLRQIAEILHEERRGRLLTGLVNRPAVYPPVLDGRAQNFFHTSLDDKVRAETDALFSAITRALQEEHDGIES